MEAGFRAAMRASLLANYMAGWPDVDENDIADHIDGRYDLFRNQLAPWVVGAGLRTDAVAIEVGCGTGSSTAALAPHVAQIIGYDLSVPSLASARDRARLLGLPNVEFRGELFDRDCEFVREGRKAGAVFLIATLEHMTLDECLAILALSWETLAPGGLLVVADTPNRLAVLDRHTSQLPFFQWLPPELRRRFASYSPRAAFAQDSTIQGSPDVLTRWGCGVSYHEFELAIPEIHRCIVRDGSEPEISWLSPELPENEMLRHMFAEFAVPAHGAFARVTLGLVARKPAIVSSA